MSRKDFEEALSRAVVGENLTHTATDPLGLVLRDVANSEPGSDARDEAIEVAHLVSLSSTPRPTTGSPGAGRPSPLAEPR